MAVPKRKTSKSKRNMRRAHDGITVAAMSECPECGETVRPHHACQSCGQYKGREVIEGTAV
ncbi:MAG: 50S ribosomal protein L32 [Mariprofundaceae bacterium]|nr:50S ribosomal protein L32 [Mariprofundaceae bacterium]MDQ6994281.1 50S ribosomal protein L32 [Mariprofundaceae bacterium]